VQLAPWLSEDPSRSLAVNVSGVQLQDPLFAQTVLRLAEARGVAAYQLVLEVTESVFFDADCSLIKQLSTLREEGARVALDDFGTGYSSLTHLARFPIEALKIDRTFIAGLDRDPRDTAIVSAVIALGAELGVSVIAEGVETLHQLGVLRRMGCPAVQGFLLDRPGLVPSWAAPAAIRATFSQTGSGSP
jgi:EAL domain-containing protein (putative c-di-GMP-specific phosphodiesterase class I)